VWRDHRDKLTIPLKGRPNDDGGNDKMIVRITELLNQTQQDIYNKAEQEMKKKSCDTDTYHKCDLQWSEYAAHLAVKHLLLILFCGRPICEDNINGILHGMKTFYFH